MYLGHVSIMKLLRFKFDNAALQPLPNLSHKFLWNSIYVIELGPVKSLKNYPFIGKYG